MKKQRYDYNIVTEKIRPLGENNYAARLDFLVRLNEKPGGPSTRLPTPEGLGEHWGKTAEEAHSKMQEAVENWISEQG
jgi:hypothetical protein